MTAATTTASTVSEARKSDKLDSEPRDRESEDYERLMIRWLCDFMSVVYTAHAAGVSIDEFRRMIDTAYEDRRKGLLLPKPANETST